MHRRIAVLVILFLSTSLVSANAQDAWVARGGSVKSMELKTAISNKDTLYIATKNVLYKAKDAKDRWESVFTIPSGGDNEINCIAGRAKVIFVGTKHGLWRSEDYGANWKKVFRTVLADRNNITYIELSKHNRFKVLIGTKKGIFLSEDLGNKWQEISGGLKDSPVRCLALNKELIYAATESGLYVMRPDVEGWQRSFVRSAGENNEYEKAQVYDYEDAEKDMSIRCIAINDSRVYIAYDQDILYSDDGAKSLNNFPSDSLKGTINYILISSKDKKMYCATTKGVFEFSPDHA